MSDCTKAEIEMLRGLRAVRQFTDEAVADEALHDILEVARWSGSAGNAQEWEFVVIRNRETLRQMAAAAGGYLRHLQTAPLAIVIVMEGKASYEDFDEGRLTERIMLAAAAHDLGAGLGWLRDESLPAVRQLLGVPAERKLRTIIAIGHTDVQAMGERTHPPQPRKPLAELVHEEQY